MNLGIVLSGGGGKGAYQIGVLKALKENNIVFNFISGVSIGSLNGIILAQNDLDEAESLWVNLENEHVFENTMKDILDKMPDYFKERYPEIKTLTQAELAKPALDENLLLKVLDSEFNYEKFKAFDGGFYACVRNCSDNITEYIDLKKMKDFEIIQFLCASCAFPGLSDGIRIDDVDYIDGGVFDNVPVKPLLDEELDLILIVHLRTKDNTKGEKYSGENIINLYPSKTLGNLITGTLDTSSVNMRERLKLGYSDGLNIIKEIGEKLGSI